MATSKKAVTVYLDDNVLEYLEKYCTEYSVMGKDKSGELKPRLATGINDLLKIMLNTPVSELDAPLKKSTKSNVDSNVLDDIVKRLDKLESFLFPVKEDSNVLENNVSDSEIEVMDTDNETTVNDSEIEVDDSIQSDTLPDNLSDTDTESIAFLESTTLPLNEDLGIITPEVVVSEETSVKSYDEAVIAIKRLKKEGLSNENIAKALTGKYYTSKDKESWTGTQVKRVLEKPENKCTDTQKI